MKNLKSLQNELLKANNSKVLSTEEKQLITGGQYSSLEDCSAECQTGTGGGFPFGNWNSWGGSSGGCILVNENPNIWDCMDS